jgi:hypothetical protein
MVAVPMVSCRECPAAVMNEHSNRDRERKKKERKKKEANKTETIFSE